MTLFVCLFVCLFAVDFELLQTLISKSSYVYNSVWLTILLVIETKTTQQDEKCVENCIEI